MRQRQQRVQFAHRLLADDRIRNQTLPLLESLHLVDRLVSEYPIGDAEPPGRERHRESKVDQPLLDRRNSLTLGSQLHWRAVFLSVFTLLNRGEPWRR